MPESQYNFSVSPIREYCIYPLAMITKTETAGREHTGGSFFSKMLKKNKLTLINGRTYINNRYLCRINY